MTETAKTAEREERTPRNLETREKSERVKKWRKPEVLPTPDPVEGYSFRWVRVNTLGNVDPSNVSAKLREGWEPVKAKDHPEIQLVTIENNRFKDNVVIGGLMLCRAPVEMVEERTEYYQEQTKRQLESVNNNLMREQDSRMPTLYNNSKSEVSFGKG
jgi:hypothetical protein